MNHLEMALVVLARARERETTESRMARPSATSRYRTAYEERVSSLRGDQYPFDFTAPTLQKRLLDYFEKSCGLTDPAGLLKAAEESRRKLLSLIWDSVVIGLHSANKELRPLAKKFTEFELFLFDQIVTSPEPAKTLMEPEVIGFAIRKFAQGLGVNFVKYLGRRLELQQTRMMAATKNKRVEVVNYADLVLARMWTDPDRPLWIAPSAGAAKLITEIIGQPLTNEAFNTLVKNRRLPRIPRKTLSNFFSVELVDPAGQRLREEFASTIGFEIEEIRPGRPGKK